MGIQTVIALRHYAVRLKPVVPEAVVAVVVVAATALGFQSVADMLTQAVILFSVSLFHWHRPETTKTVAEPVNVEKLGAEFDEVLGVTGGWA